jgi:hypothetical protein
MRLTHFKVMISASILGGMLLIGSGTLIGQLIATDSSKATLDGNETKPVKEDPKTHDRAKKELSGLAKEIVKMKVLRVLNEKEELSRAEKTIDDQQKIAQLLEFFPEVGTDKKPDAALPNGGARLSGTAYSITLHPEKGEPFYITIRAGRELWCWSQGDVQSAGDWNLKKPKEVGKFLDDLLDLPEKKEIPALAKEIVRITLMRHLDAKGERSRSTKRINDRETIERLLSYFPETGIDPKSNEGSAKPKTEGGMASFVILLDQKNDKRMEIDVAADRTTWCWFTGFDKIVWNLKTHKGAVEFLDELLDGTSKIEKVSKSEEKEPSKDTKEPDKVSEKLKKHFGQKTIDILSGATKVEVFQLEKEKAVRKTTPKTIGTDDERWIITNTGKEKDKEFAGKVRQFLIDEPLRLIDEMIIKRWGALGSGVRADVAFQLWKEKESVTVIVDYDQCYCLIITRDAEGKQTKINGVGFRYNAKDEYDDGTLFARAKSLAVEAFPDDKKIKSLKQPEEDYFPPVGDKVPENLLTMLEKAEKFEFLSLNPELLNEKAEDEFHGYKILGKTTIKEEETRKKLIDAFKKGVEENNGAAAACFRPRHGIRVTFKEKTADFVICLECLYMQIFIDDKAEKGLRTTGSPKEIYNSVLKEAKVPLPKN